MLGSCQTRILGHKISSIAAATHTVIEADRVDDHEIRQVVFVRRIIAVPCDDIERRVILRCLEKRPLELRDDCVTFYGPVFKPSCRGEKVTWIGQAVGAAEGCR